MKTIKVLAGSLAAITVGATLALGIFAAPITSLGDYVKVSGSALNSPMIVIGDGATAASGFAQDVVGAADIAAAVAGYATTSVSAGTVDMGVSGGVDISTANTKLYLDDSISKAKSTLTKNDLPTLLASGSMTDTAGAIYNFDQYITLNSGTPSGGAVTTGAAVTFTSNTGGGLNDPDFILALSTAPKAPIINYTVVFNKQLNVSSTNVQNKKIKLLGIDYTIGSTSSSTGAATDQIVLYGSSLVQTMAGGEEKKITIGGTEYTVKVLGALSSPASSAAISVNGETQTVTKSTSYTLSGLPVYIEDVFYLSTTDQTQNSVKLSFGTNKLTLQNGQPVQKGNAPDSVDGTYVQLPGSSASGISTINIGIAAKDTSHNFAQQGTAFADPVFGAFKLVLGGLSGGTTEKITIDNSGTTGASLQFTDYRGNANTLLWAYTGSISFAPSLNSTSTQTYIVVENQTAKLNDYVLFTPTQESDFSHILQYSAASGLGTSNSYIELKDVMTSTTSRMYLNDAGSGTASHAYIDGQQIWIQNVTNEVSTFDFTWGTNSGLHVRGDLVTVFPLVRTSKGGWVTLAPGNASVTTVSVTGGLATLELPGGSVAVGNGGTGYANITCGSTTNIILTAGNATNFTCAPGRLAYSISMDNTTNVATVVPMFGKAQAQWPVVIFREEKAKDATTAQTEVQDFVVTTVGAGSGTGVNLAIQQPNITATTQDSGALQSVSTQTKYVDRRGTVVNWDSASQGLVTITYPDEQAVATVAVGDNPVFSAGTAGTVQQAIKITSPIGKLASEVSATAPGADLILVGGPCANSLVAKLLSSSNVTCDNWNYTTGIIKEVTGGFTDGSRALIVAGTLAKDTRDLAKMLIQGTLTYAV